MDSKLSLCVVLLATLGAIGLVEGNQVMAMVEKLIAEKVTDPQLAALVTSKLPEVQVCLMTMAAMTPEVTVKV
ncbi:unnamed protein product, partial [Ixodes hexagonus]